MPMPWKSIGAAVLCVLMATSAHAQQIAGSFDQLRVLVKPGDTLTVTTWNGTLAKGKLLELPTTQLILQVNGQRRDFSPADIETIRMRGNDPLRNGALWGFGIGAAMGVLAGATIGAEGGLVIIPMAALMYGGMFAGVGAGIDAMIEGPQIIYAQTSTSSRVAVSPMLSAARKGVVLSMRF